MSNSTYLKWIALLLAFILPTVALSEEKRKSSVGAQSTGAIVLSAPPLGSEQDALDRYEPVARYLSQILGKKVVYRHPSSWRVFHAQMRKGAYDLVFDSAHLNSYRVQNLNHTVLAKAPKKKQYVVVTKLDNLRYQKIQDLAGRTICASAPPELSTAMVVGKFNNPMRQPLIVNTEGAQTIFDNVLKRKCEAGIVALSDFKKLDPRQRYARAVHITKSVPAQAFSASPRLSKREQNKIIRALTSASSIKPTANLRSAFNVGERFTRGSNNEYLGLAQYVNHEWGFN